MRWAGPARQFARALEFEKRAGGCRGTSNGAEEATPRFSGHPEPLLTALPALDRANGDTGGKGEADDSFEPPKRHGGVEGPAPVQLKRAALFVMWRALLSRAFTGALGCLAPLAGQAEPSIVARLVKSGAYDFSALSDSTRRDAIGSFPRRPHQHGLKEHRRRHRADQGERHQFPHARGAGVAGEPQGPEGRGCRHGAEDDRAGQARLQQPGFPARHAMM